MSHKLIKICLILQLLCSGPFLLSGEQKIVENIKNDLRAYEIKAKSFESPILEDMVYFSVALGAPIAAALGTGYLFFQSMKQVGFDYYDWAFSCNDYAFDDMGYLLYPERNAVICNEYTRSFFHIVLTFNLVLILELHKDFFIEYCLRLSVPAGKGLAILTKKILNFYYKGSLIRSTDELIAKLESYDEKENKEAFFREHFRIILQCKNESLIKLCLSRYMVLRDEEINSKLAVNESLIKSILLRFFELGKYSIDPKIALYELLHVEEIDSISDEINKNTELDECIICLEEYSELRKGKLLICGHVYCETCLKKCKASCPECRKSTINQSFDLRELLGK